MILSLTLHPNSSDTMHGPSLTNEIYLSKSRISYYRLMLVYRMVSYLSVCIKAKLYTNER